MNNPLLITDDNSAAIGFRHWTDGNNIYERLVNINNNNNNVIFSNSTGLNLLCFVKWKTGTCFPHRLISVFYNVPTFDSPPWICFSRGFVNFFFLHFIYDRHFMMFIILYGYGLCIHLILKYRYVCCAITFIT